VVEKYKKLIFAVRFALSFLIFFPLSCSDLIQFPNFTFSTDIENILKETPFQ